MILYSECSSLNISSGSAETESILVVMPEDDNDEGTGGAFSLGHWRPRHSLSYLNRESDEEYEIVADA